MTKYSATISHHSISRARSIEIDGTLAQAKRAASKEFNGEFNDYHIIIRPVLDNGMIDRDEIVSSRRVGGRTWHDAQ